MNGTTDLPRMEPKHVLRAGVYWRAVELFIRVNDVERKDASEKFLVAVRSVYGQELGERHAVPYTDGDAQGFLPAYRLKPPRAKGTHAIATAPSAHYFANELLDTPVVL